MNGKIRRITESAAKAQAQELLKRAGHESAQLYEAARWQAVPHEEIELFAACILGNVNGNDVIYSDTAKDVLIMSLIDAFNMGRIRGIQQERKRRNKKK